MFPFDWELDLCKYEGYTRFERLFHWLKCTSFEHQQEIAPLLINECHLQHNTQAYEKLYAEYYHVVKHLPMDMAFLETTKKNEMEIKNRLEKELMMYKNNLIKESIRATACELGDLYCRHGELQQALKNYLRSRDFCTQPGHTIDMAMSVIQVGIHLKNYANVPTYIGRIETTLPKYMNDDGDLIKGHLVASQGLSMLHNKRYLQAAMSFLTVPANIGSTFNKILHVEDVAIYGGLCALATLDRKQLKSMILDSPSFKYLLETKIIMRDLITDFYESKYASVFTSMSKMKSDLFLDIHLHDHVDELYTRIRSRAIVLYFTPYFSVDLNTMAQSFESKDVESLTEEVGKLIVEGKLSARIDSGKKILYMSQVDTRQSTFDDVFTLGKTYLADTKASLLRMNLVKNEMIVGSGAVSPTFKSSLTQLTRASNTIF